MSLETVVAKMLGCNFLLDVSGVQAILTKGSIVQFILVHLATQRAKFTKLQLLSFDSVSQSSQTLVFCCHLMVSCLLLLQKSQALLFGHQQLVLRVDLVLLPAGHLLKLAQSQLHPVRQLKTEKIFRSLPAYQVQHSDKFFCPKLYIFYSEKASLCKYGPIFVKINLLLEVLDL